MRDRFRKNRGWILTGVADGPVAGRTFLTVVRDFQHLAQADPARSAAELAIDAAIPRPEPAKPAASDH